jgi:hypothetical protein
VDPCGATIPRFTPPSTRDGCLVCRTRLTSWAEGSVHSRVATASTTGTARTLRSVPEQAVAAKVRTDTEDKLWDALHAAPNSTAADLWAITEVDTQDDPTPVDTPAAEDADTTDATQAKGVAAKTQDKPRRFALAPAAQEAAPAPTN